MVFALDSHHSASYKILKIEIIDYGSGISQEKLATLFDKPEIIETNESEDGRLKIGVGLWVTKNIVEAMDGKINVHSKLRKGTSVVITIPVELSSIFNSNNFSFMKKITNSQAAIP
mmetsp:Transcript_18189/g.15857  ORF Transcript_18189/g.15857 Transcript_18189/m.15857 type:complete len:116 (+) Transcript_18189:1222-1569(+)